MDSTDEENSGDEIVDEPEIVEVPVDGHDSDSDMEVTAPVISKQDITDSYINLLTNQLTTLQIQTTNWWPTNDYMTPTLQAMLTVLPKVIKFGVAEPEKLASLGINLLPIDNSISKETLQCIMLELAENYVLITTRVPSSNNVHQFMDTSWALITSNPTHWNFNSELYGLVLSATSPEMKENVVLNLTSSWLTWLKENSKCDYKQQFRKWSEQSDISLLLSCITTNCELYKTVCSILLQLIEMTNGQSESLINLFKYLGGNTLLEQFHLLPAPLQTACFPLLYGAVPNLTITSKLSRTHITWLAIIRNSPIPLA